MRLATLAVRGRVLRDVYGPAESLWLESGGKLGQKVDFIVDHIYAIWRYFFPPTNPRAIIDPNYSPFCVSCET